MTERAYSAPPIVDAIIELRFEDALDDAVRERASKKFSDAYPLVEEGVHQAIGVDLSADTISVRTDVTERVTKRRTLEGPALIQIGNHIFGVATGAPYQGWDELFGRFVDHWTVAKKVWGYRKIKRIGVRYINRLDLSHDENGRLDYERYLNLRINLPEEFPDILNYELRFETSIPEIKCGATVQSGAIEPAVPGQYSFALDVDLWRLREVPQKDAEVLSLLGMMRSSKNDLFETFITDEARKVFNAAK